MKTIHFVLLVSLMLLQITSCKKEPAVEDEYFDIVSSKKYMIESTAGFKVEDELSGSTFSFPSGGSGDLTVSTLSGGPVLNDPEAVRFMVDYSGSGQIEMLIPVTAAYTQAYVYGPITGASVKPNIGEFSWGVMIEQDTVDGYLRFLLDPGDLEPGTKSTVKKYSPPESKYFAITNLSKDSGTWTKLVAFYNSIKQVVTIWLDALPESEATRLRALMADEMKFDVRSSGSNYYQHFNNWVWGKNAIFYLKPETTLAGIAHETGHYMTHLLCGYNQYSQIYDRIPKEYWGLGGSIDHLFGTHIDGRLYVLEDYAHFSEFLVLGTLEDHDLYNVASVNYFSQAIAGDPAQKDYPCYEGFGAAMLAALMRTQSEIYTFDIKDKKKVKVPVVGASLGDVIQRVIAHGSRDVNELYINCLAYLADLGGDQPDKWPAMLEPLGWSYYGSGYLVDKEDKKLEGVFVRPVVIAGEEYPGDLSSATDAEGKFSVKGLPPGNSVLRVYDNLKDGVYQDSADIEITIDYTRKTNEEVPLGKHVVEFKDQLETYVATGLFNTRIYQPSSTYTGPVITSLCDFNAQYTMSTKNYHRLGSSFLENTDVSSLISLTIDCKTNSPVTATFTINWSMSDYNWEWESTDQSMYLKQVISLGPYPEIEEENYYEGSYAPYFTWSQQSDGSVTGTMTFNPEEIFAVERSRRFRLNVRFTGTSELYLTGGGKNSYKAVYSPSSVVFSVSKRY